MSNLYDEFLIQLKKTAEARLILGDAVSKLGIPEIYLYDGRYTILFVITEISFRKKGYFVASDLKQQTSLSDKSVERFIKFLLGKNFFYTKRGKDKRIKRYYPSNELEVHIRGTWAVRIKQIEAVLDLTPSKYKEILKFLKEDKYDS
tara:strand:+ start:974 stop:1414 length:441 start_codon:yes stop_codon:yes gene_type:complete